jgi:putative DNA primase/helicase
VPRRNSNTRRTQATENSQQANPTNNSPPPPPPEPERYLSGRDRDELRSSGLSDATIAATGWYSSGDAIHLATILKRKVVQGRHGRPLRPGRSAEHLSFGALVIPYYDLQENIVYYRVKPHAPRTDKKGKPVKYEAPAGVPPRLYYPRSTRDRLRAVQPGQPPLTVHIVEGEKKAERAAQEGLTVVAIAGVYSWKVKRTENLIGELEALARAGHTFVVTFDYDPKVKTRHYTAGAAKRLARSLLKAGATEVRVPILPPGADPAVKQGFDDFLNAHRGNLDGYLRLVALAKPVTLEAEESPHELADRTESASARRLVKQFGKRLRYVVEWGKWVVWDGKRWRVDTGAILVQGKGMEVARRLWEEVAAAADYDARKRLVTYAKATDSANGIASMVRLARSLLPIGVARLDRDPWLLNVRNGTLDLRTGQLRPHRRRDCITKLCPVAYDPAATCPLWDKFLAGIFDGDEDLIGYMARLVGYCLTGCQTEHILPFLHGDGANGKTTFVERLMNLLGPDYATKAPPDLLLAKRGEAHPTERADLFGKRFVACVETESGRRLAEALFKEMTGGDRMKARRMREDFWEFTPTHHVWLAGNHKPAVVGQDHGTWRRIKLIPFEVQFWDPDTKPKPGEERPEALRADKRIGEKLDAELPGILAWAVRGCLDWQKNGMQEPAVVGAKTTEYEEEQDVVGRFIEDHCEVGPYLIGDSGALYKKFKELTNSRMTNFQFGKELDRRGFPKQDGSGKEYRTPGGKRGRKGIRLKDEADEADEAARSAEQAAGARLGFDAREREQRERGQQ